MILKTRWISGQRPGSRDVKENSWGCGNFVRRGMTELLNLLPRFAWNFMIQRIHIQNYAIIDELSIEFSHRMNVITGETGAGKSILMGALSLILGDWFNSALLLRRDE